MVNEEQILQNYHSIAGKKTLDWGKCKYTYCIMNWWFVLRLSKGCNILHFLASGSDHRIYIQFHTCTFPLAKKMDHCHALPWNFINMHLTHMSCKQIVPVSISSIDLVSDSSSNIHRCVHFVCDYRIACDLNFRNRRIHRKKSSSILKHSV